MALLPDVVMAPIPTQCNTGIYPHRTSRDPDELRRIATVLTMADGVPQDQFSGPIMIGTADEALKRLDWFISIRDDETWAAPAAYALCRRMLECWPKDRMVPFFYTTHQGDGAILMHDDEHSAAVRISPASIALETWDWATEATNEHFSSIDTVTIRRTLPTWLDIIDQSETFDEWVGLQEDEALPGLNLCREAGTPRQEGPSC